MTVIAQLATSPALDGRFLLVETLGHGGQGRVFHAYDRVFRREVAIKALHDARDHGSPPPLSAEFAAWARLRHPHIVRAYELQHAASGPLPRGTPYLVLELVRGLPVHRALRAGHERPAILEELARRLLRALDHVHGAGIVHRDIKPGNVLVGPARGRLGRVKLTDFGLASESGRTGEPGRISGSIPYVAPETILGLAVDGRADLYGLGVLLFYLGTGQLPIISKAPDRWLRWHLEGPPADPRLVRPQLPARFAALVTALTARARDARPASAAEALRMLGSGPVGGTVGRDFGLAPGERARVRFALDGTRAGSWREFPLPGRTRDAQAVHRELVTLSATLGVTCLRLERDVGARLSNVARLVLTVLLAHGPAARRHVEQHGLHHSLPIAVLCGVPVWNRNGHDEERARRPRERCAAAKGITGFLRDTAEARPLVIIVEPAALSDPLAAAVVARLRRLIAQRPPRPGAGGLLLAVPD